MGHININSTSGKFDMISSLKAGVLNIFIVKETKKIAHFLETSFQPTFTNLT